MKAATGAVQFQGKDGVYDVSLTAGSAVGLTGNVNMMFDYYNVDTGGFLASVVVAPTSEAITAWQIRAWNQLRTAALAT